MQKAKKESLVDGEKTAFPSNTGTLKWFVKYDRDIYFMILADRDYPQRVAYKTLDVSAIS